jgi:hypothetical protein
MIGPRGIRPVAVAMMLAPLLVALAYVLAFLACHRQRGDVLDRIG